MLQKREKKFLEDLYPILSKLKDKWFSADTKSPEGYYYVCPYCDCQYSHERHDSDCLMDLAKAVIEELERLDALPPGKRWNGNIYSDEEWVSITENNKFRFVLDKLIKPSFKSFIPVDFEDSTNHSICCICNMLEDDMSKHKEDCPYVNIAKVLSTLFSI